MIGLLQMEAVGWVGISPALMLAATALAIFGYDMIRPDATSQRVIVAIALIGSVSATILAGALLLTGAGPELLFGGALIVDGFALFFALVVALVTTLVLLGAADYLGEGRHRAEFYTLVLFAATGMTLMAAAQTLATVFVALELASLPSYALVAYLKQDRGSVEAGLKYFLVGAVASAIFAFGISLVYAGTGVLRLDGIATALAETGVEPIVGVGVIFLLAGFAFKTAAVPVHLWAPAAYEGAPSPVSAFLSSASKAAGFAIAIRVLMTAFPIETVGAAVDWVLLVQIIAVATMLVGNFAAAVQTTVKRMLAYSSIGHAGYGLIGLAAVTAGGPTGDVIGATMAHLFVYGFMNTGAFLFIGLTEHWQIGRSIRDFDGLAADAPIAAVAMTVFLFSLAGLPFFGGFISKYALFTAAIGAGVWWLAAVGALTSALSVYYYSKVVRAMWIEDATMSRKLDRPIGLYTAIVLAAVVTVLLLPGFGPVIETAQAIAAAL